MYLDRSIHGVKESTTLLFEKGKQCVREGGCLNSPPMTSKRYQVSQNKKGDTIITKKSSSNILPIHVFL